jgi:uncharacterized protein YciI
MNTYIYVLKLSERLYDEQAWTKSDEQAVQAHFNRIKADFELGKIIHVGRTENPNQDGFGLVIFKANSLEEANAFMNADPAVIGKQMSATVFPYKQIL